MSFSAVLVAAQYSLVQGVGEAPSFLGVFSAGLGAGSIVASLVSGRLLRATGERRLAVLGLANFALGNALRATGWLPLAIAGSVVLGFALPWVFLAVLNLAQRCTPPELQGRVSAAVTLVFFGPQAPLQAVGALAIRYASYRPALRRRGGDRGGHRDRLRLDVAARPAAAAEPDDGRDQRPGKNLGGTPSESPPPGRR